MCSTSGTCTGSMIWASRCRVTLIIRCRLALKTPIRLRLLWPLFQGVSFNARNSDKAQEYNATTKEITNFADSKNNAVNAQIGLFWDINTSHS